MNPENVLIRPALDVDRSQVWRLVRAFAHAYVANESVFATNFSDLIDRPDTLVSVAELDAKVIGCLLASYHGTFFANGSVVWIEEVLVAKSLRETSVGRSLMARAEERATALPTSVTIVGESSIRRFLSET
jgi:predicted N-acetyltransferase YhbS